MCHQIKQYALVTERQFSNGRWNKNQVDECGILVLAEDKKI